jgi:serine/threonine-protein kinase RsbW
MVIGMPPARLATTPAADRPPPAAAQAGPPPASAALPGSAPALRKDRHWIVTLDGPLLRQVRKAAGLSQEQLASAAGMSPATIGKLEREARPRCHFRTRARVAAALGAYPQAITATSGGCPSDVTDQAGQHSAARAFPARPDQVGQARAFASQVLGECPAAADLVLICSELAANAVRHSASARPGGEFTVRVSVRADRWARVEVADQGGPWTARIRQREDSRGLIVVDELAASWDIRGDDTGRVIGAWLTWDH